MPVFHTKTIESILEPVAQQVSKLVILHEEAEDGNAMPDLARPVQAVKLAVDNLIKVGYETINNSEDQILKQDMPPALNRVEEASILLLEASDMLRSDPYSAPARKKLIGGSRGILQGTSALLLAFDESEVRKIIRVCKNVLEYLAITEVVENMEDLVTFVKNLSPVLTKMTRDVDGREKELTHQVHREWLIRSLEQVKTLTPVLISGIKIFITTKTSGGQGLVEATNNRDYVVSKMSKEIEEMIRVLQLTTYDEEEWDADDLTVMKKALNSIDSKLKQALDWLADSNALPGSSGERALRAILEEALKIAERCVNPDDRDAIVKMVGDITSMTDALCELRSAGKGNSPQAMSLARGIGVKLHELRDLCARAVMNTERSGIRRPAPTLEGKLEQAKRWMHRPEVDDKGLGEDATRMIIAEGRKVADGLQGAKKGDLLRNCDEAEILCNQLSDLCRRGMGATPQAKQTGQELARKVDGLKNKIQEALTQQVADDFLDISTPLKQLSEAALAAPGTPNRDMNFGDKSDKFDKHAHKLANTARLVATAGTTRNKRTVEAINAGAQQSDELTPQVIQAAKIVLTNPGNQASQEHFELLKKQWLDNMEKLRDLVDEATDTAAFIKAQEEGILKDTAKTEDSIGHQDPPGVVNNTSNIARRANRCLQKAQQEADNSEDLPFVDRINNALRNLRPTVSPMVQAAKGVAQNVRDPNAAGKWRGNNNNLIDAVKGLRRAIPGEDDISPEMDQLALAAARDAAAREAAAREKAARDAAERAAREAAARDAAAREREAAARAAAERERAAREKAARDAAAARDKAARDAAAARERAAAEREREAREAADRERANRERMAREAAAAQEAAARAAAAREAAAREAAARDRVPPRPPMPRDLAPPRPPPPETDTEDEEAFPTPQANQPIMMAAHALHMDVKEWSSRDNDIIAAAKRMALLMARLSQLVRGEGGSKKDLIDCAKAIAEASEEVTRLAKELARECTDKRMRTSLLQVCERIPTIGTQLKILSTVKATMLGAQEPIPSPDGSEITCGSEEDQEATELLVGNAQNLMQSVRETVRAAQAASIKIRVESGYSMRWHRKRPWYT